MFASPVPEKMDYLLVVRGMAAIGVLLSHELGIGAYSIGNFIAAGTSGTFADIGPQLDPLKRELYVLVPLLGVNFVVLFFVQSGYLMGKVFFDRKYDLTKNRILSFYHNRLLRLVPLLYFNLLIGVALFDGANLNVVKLVGDLLFITNFTDRGINLVTWSLSHEVQYYLLCPFIFWVFGNPSLRTFISSLVLAVALYVVTRGGFLGHFAYLYAFVAGFSVNILLRIVPARVSERAKIATVIVGMLLISGLYNWLYLVELRRLGEISVVAISATIVFVTECRSNYEITDRFPLLRLFVRFWMLTGVLTYSIYLWHYMIVRVRSPTVAALVDIVAPQHLWEKIALYHAIDLPLVLILSYALAWITFHLIELRFRPGLYGVQNVLQREKVH